MYPPLLWVDLLLIAGLFFLVDFLFVFLTRCDGAGGFPQVSDGVNFTINRVTGRCGEIRIKGKPLDPARTYRIATNSYLAAGGDGYRMFLNAVDRYDSSRFLRDVFADYLKYRGGVITPSVGGRITVITNSQAYLPWRLVA